MRSKRSVRGLFMSQRNPAKKIRVRVIVISSCTYSAWYALRNAVAG